MCVVLRCNDVAASRYLSFRSGFVVTSDRPSPLSIGAPAQSLGLADAVAASLGSRACRFATMEAATRLARLCSDLAAAAGPRPGSAKEPPAWRRAGQMPRSEE